jgi:hypothetical protein
MMTRRLFLLLAILTTTVAFAGDYHQDGSGHKVVYTVTDSFGDPVSGQTIRCAVQRGTDGYFLDFSDQTFKASGWSQRLFILSYDTVGEYYSTVITIDQATLVSSDYVITVSNDSALYGDHQSEVVNWDSLSNLVKIYR